MDPLTLGAGAFGAVALWMGGRGPSAGTGVAPWIGGRSGHQDYVYRNPNAVVTGWSNFDVYGADREMIETVSGIDTFFRRHFTAEGRVERLTGKIEKAQAQVDELAESSEDADPEKLEAIAEKIAKLEQLIDRWSAKVDKISAKGSFGSNGVPSPEDLEDKADELAQHMAKSGRMVTNEDSSDASRAAALTHFVAANDALQKMAKKSAKTSLPAKTKASIARKASAASSVFGAIQSQVDPEEVFGATRCLASSSNVAEAAGKAMQESTFGMQSSGVLNWGVNLPDEMTEDMSERVVETMFRE